MRIRAREHEHSYTENTGTINRIFRVQVPKASGKVGQRLG